VIVTAAKPGKRVRSVPGDPAAEAEAFLKAHAAAVRDSDVGLAALFATVRRISRCCGWSGGWQMISRFRYTVSGNDRTEAS
jgi:hypothetical protein